MSIIDVYFWWVPMLADTASNSGISPEAVGVIVGGVITALLGGGWVGKKVADAKKVTIDPQPLVVQMSEEFVTRREFVELKSEIRNDVTEIKGLFRETMREMTNRSKELTDKMDRQQFQLTEKLKEVIDEDRAGRVAIWKQHNPLSNEVAALKVNSDVAGQIGKLADAITKTHDRKTTN